MAAPVPAPVASAPGVRRDGTRFSATTYLEALWTRFDEAKGNPMKIGGYRSLSSAMGGLSRGLHIASRSGTAYIHSGSADRLEQLKILPDGSIVPVALRTPSGFVANADYTWQFGVMRDVVAGGWKLIAHAAPNGLHIDSSTDTTVWIGDLDSPAPLVQINDKDASNVTIPFKVSGGIAAIHPFMFYFGNDGQTIWSVSNHPEDVVSGIGASGTNIASGEARPTGKKIIAGRATRGAGVPSGLLWSLDTLVRASYSGGSTTWDFDEISGIEILSAQGIAEYNGAFYWIGGDRFSTYNGVVRDVPNPYNRRWFFDNITRGREGRMFAFANPKHGEIWFCAPMFGAPECNHAVVLQVNTGVWYDTPLPNGGRSAAVSPISTYRYPLMAGVDEMENTYTLWQHETGVDEVDKVRGIKAIKAYYVTSDISFMKAPQSPSGNSVEVLTVEPDFKQSGALSITVIGNDNAASEDITGDPVLIDVDGDGVAELAEERRQLRFKVESNTKGGDFEAGATYAFIRQTGAREHS
jgi:hypothetical protein